MKDCERTPRAVPGRVQSVGRAAEILKALAGVGSGLSLASIAQRVGINQSTAHHLLATLRTAGFVDQDPTTRAYRLGYGLIGLVTNFVMSTDLYAAGTGPARELRDLTGETVYLIASDGAEQVPIVELPGYKAIQARPTRRPGETSLHSTAKGKAYLSGLHPARLDALLSSLALTKFTPNTIDDPATLKDELVRIRDQGFALDLEENIAGVMCVAGVVRGAHGDQVGSVDVSFPRADQWRIDELIRLVLNTAAQISRNLGYASDSHRRGDQRTTID